MFEAADIREWRGHDVVDDSGHKIGTLESVYVDTSTDEPSFATVTVGLPTRHRLVSTRSRKHPLRYERAGAIHRTARRSCTSSAPPVPVVLRCLAQSCTVESPLAYLSGAVSDQRLGCLRTS